MAGELKVSFQPGKVVYVLVFNSVGQVWNANTSAMEAYLSANLATYAVSTVQQGSSPFYVGNFPSTVVTGIYDCVARQQVGGSAAETDPVIGVEDGFSWNGTVRVSLSDLATSGQVGQLAPLRLSRGTMVKPFPLYFKSSLDHVTPFTSGVVSGQISRDGGAFGALQSGAFSEVGLGAYSLQALTSGDLLANSVMMVFTAAGISGGQSDPLPMAFITQRTSGQ